jgi:galactokinase
MKSFADCFGAAPQVTARAPGRVNLLGEHTDYNDGWVLPIAIPQQTTVRVARGAGGVFRLYAAEIDACAQFAADRPPAEQFAKYVYGCIAELQRAAHPVPALDIHVESDVPIGVGLSSSAALEVATLRALRELLRLPLDDVEIAKLAQRAEIEHAGVRCGILDQMAASIAATDRALLLDIRSLEYRHVALPPATAAVVLDSGIARSLASSGYNARRAECEQAARALGVGSLRELQSAPDWQRIDALPPPLAQRVRHVVTENERVLAAHNADAHYFGALMNASHVSLRDDYQVSVPPLDLLVDLLQREPGVYGARLTGAGFGGACVALVAADSVSKVPASVLARYANKGFRGRQLV